MGNFLYDFVVNFECVVINGIIFDCMIIFDFLVEVGLVCVWKCFDVIDSEVVFDCFEKEEFEMYKMCCEVFFDIVVVELFWCCVVDVLGEVDVIVEVVYCIVEFMLLIKSWFVVSWVSVVWWVVWKMLFLMVCVYWLKCFFCLVMMLCLIFLGVFISLVRVIMWFWLKVWKGLVRWCLFFVLLIMCWCILMFNLCLM